MAKITVKMPQELLAAMHIYVVAAHTMASMASDQPEELRGKEPGEIFEATVLSVAEIFEAKSKTEQIQLLVLTARKLAETSGAVSIKAEIREG